MDAHTARALIEKGLLLGTVHVLAGPDHISALAALTAGEPFLKAFYQGIKWGFGHSLGLLIVAFIFLSIGDDIKMDLDEIGSYCDWIVGVLMILLGAYTMWRACKQAPVDVEKEEPVMLHALDPVEEEDEDEKKKQSTSRTSEEEEGGGGVKEMKKAEEEEGEEGQVVKQTALKGGDEEKPKKSCWEKTKHRSVALLVGIVHGAAGPGGILGVIPAVQLRSWGKSLLYLLTFCVASDLAMGLVGAIYGELTSKAGLANNNLTYYLRVFSALLSIVVGVLWIVFSSLGILDQIFH